MLMISLKLMQNEVVTFLFIQVFKCFANLSIKIINCFLDDGEDEVISDSEFLINEHTNQDMVDNPGKTSVFRLSFFIICFFFPITCRIYYDHWMLP